MRYKEIIKESSDEKYKALIDKYKIDDHDILDQFSFIEKIKKDCQPFLLQAVLPFGKNAIYRGMRQTEKFITKAIRLQDRKPVDTNQLIHDGINEYFIANFKEPFRNSLFVSGSLSATKEYGFPYYIFPIGDFRFLWSPEVEDLFTVMPILKDEKERPNEYDLNRIAGFYDKYLPTYQPTELYDAIMSNNEIMIRGTGYYAISASVPINNIQAFAEILKK